MKYELDGKLIFAHDGFGALGKWYFLPFILYIVAVSVACCSLIYGVVWDLGPVGAEWPPSAFADWVLFGMMLIGAVYLPFHLIERVYRILNAHLRFVVTDSGFTADGLLGRERFFPNESIVSVRPLPSVRGARGMVLEARDGTKLKPLMPESGALLETLLPRLNAVQEVVIPDSHLQPEYWGKEPDWDIINAAIARAEANCKKKEQEEQS